MARSAISSKIFELRKSKRLTQADLGKLVGISGVAISQFEKGDTIPSQNTVSKLSAALEFDFSSIWSEASAPDKVRDDYIELDYWPIGSYSFISTFASGDGEQVIADRSGMLISNNSVPVLIIPGVEYVGSQVIEIKGDSMSPRYPHSARYVIKMQYIEEDVLRLARGPHLFLLKDTEPFVRRITSTTRGMLTLKADANGEEMEFEISDIQQRWLMGTCLIFKLGQAVYMPAED